jgi:benzoyl-CoA reductase/2-hydroxyglutaryl-CoA dehydratase subunit BcrC/BadD/HgdB
VAAYRGDRNLSGETRMKQIGITTTIPVEIVLASGRRPVDLNNVLVSDARPEHLVAIAERAGFPLNCCAWIKGIYGVCLEKGIEDVICVTTGDCSNTIMLNEVLRHRALNTITFAYPPQPDVAAVGVALSGLANALGTTVAAGENVRAAIRMARELTRELDRLTWQKNKISGLENHYWLVSSSDFNGDYDAYCRDVTALIATAGVRQPYPADELRLAYIGVPPVFARDLYPYIERCGARVVFNEVQRQFSLPKPGSSLAEEYARYTYPYTINGRIADIAREISRRRVDGIIHYVQAFCHRGIGDIIFRETLGLPVLTLEGNDNFFLSSHEKTRIEAFLDVLERRRRPRK